MLEGSRAENYSFNHQWLSQTSVKSTVLSKVEKPIIFYSHLHLCSLLHVPTTHTPGFTQGPAVGSVALASVVCSNICRCLAQACKSQSLASLPCSAFRDVMLLAQNWLW